jgi:hypothetical protein
MGLARVSQVFKHVMMLDVLLFFYTTPCPDE